MGKGIPVTKCLVFQEVCLCHRMRKTPTEGWELDATLCDKDRGADDDDNNDYNDDKGWISGDLSVDFNANLLMIVGNSRSK